MNIVFINQHYKDNLCGSQIVCDSYMNYLTKKGHKITLINPIQNPYDCEKYISSYSIVNSSANGGDIAKAINSVNPEIIYWNLNLFHLRSTILGIKNREKIKLVFAQHNANDLMIFPSNPFSYKDDLMNLKFIKYYCIHIYNITALKYFDGFTTINREYLADIKSTQKLLIHNPVTSNVKKFKWNKPYICWVGVVKKKKRPELFYKLANDSRFKNIDFLMVGPLKKDYAWVKNTNGEYNNFFYIGEKPIELVNGIMKNSIFFCMTYEKEGYSLTAIQAFQQKKPVLTYSFDPNSDIENYSLGFNAKGDWEKFKKFTCLLIQDKEKNSTIGQNGYKFAKENFNLKKSADSLVEFFSKLKKI